MTKQPPTSLRIPGQTKQRVHAYAAERGIPRNAAYVELLDRALAVLRNPNGLSPRRDLSGPLAAANEKLREVVAHQPHVDVQIGPTRPKPGERSKGAKRP